jgi:hypothetical protein
MKKYNFYECPYKIPKQSVEFSVIARLNYIREYQLFDQFNFDRLKIIVPSFKNQPRFIKENCARIKNDIENAYYFLDDIIFFGLHKIINDEDTPYDFTVTDIDALYDLYTDKRLASDDLQIREGIKALNLNYEDVFCIQAEGMSIITSLVLEGKISPLYYINNRKKVLTLPEKCVYLSNDVQKRFDDICDLIKNNPTQRLQNLKTLKTE